MKIETHKQENSILELTVEVDEERVQPALRAAARQLAKRYPVPGFRPGKAPYDVILRQFGEGALYEAAVEDLGQKVYAEALEQEKIDAYGPGALEDVQLKPMVLKFSVPLRPEVELGDYRALQLPYTPPEIKDEQVNEALEHLREHQAVMEPVDRPAELTDVAVLDVKGYLNTGENPSDFLLADQDISLLLDEKTDWPVPGFAPFIVGLKAGEEKKFDLTFPDDYANESLRGQTAHFEVTVKEVKQRTLPEWNDELAKTIGDYQTLDEMRARVREDLANQAERTVEQEYNAQIMDRLLEQAHIRYPLVLLEEEVDDLLEDLDRRLHEQRLTLDDYLKIEGKTKEALREEYKPRAEERLKRALILGKVVELEQLDVSDTDVDDQIEKLSTPFGEQAGRIRELFGTKDARRTLGVDLLTQKALKRLSAIARGEQVPLPGAAEAQPEARHLPAGQAGRASPGVIEGQAEAESAPAAEASAQ